MGNIGIITINDYNNYGNRLQNYALQEVIKLYGFSCETILNTTFIKNENINLEQSKKNKIKRALSRSLSDNYAIFYKKINKKRLIKSNELRMSIFKEFTKKYINETLFSVDYKKNIDNKLHVNYNFIVSGSDQVWNPYLNTTSEINFLTFAPKNKRISYAASFGVSDIPLEYKEDYKKWLSDMNHISVREEDGAKIVKELTDKDVYVVIDPTMLLIKEKWLSISKKSESKPNKNYLLTYLLGGGTDDQKKVIKKIAKKNNLEIVNLGDIRYEKYYITGPSEFIDYINDASVFFTDSFHGCVFSMLLETPFIVCNRVGQNEKTSMESRIDTFLSKFKLESRRYSNIEKLNIFECDYMESYELLEEERKKANDYLKKVLNIEN